MKENVKKDLYKCPHCSKYYKKLGLGSHIWRMHGEGKDFNPNSGYSNGTRKVWNKGLTKDNDDRVYKFSKTMSEKYASGELKGSFWGKKHTNKTKESISKTRKIYLLNNPNKVPYILNHYSKGPSYPELYWLDLIKNENLPFEYHKRIGLYELDFYNEKNKIDLEIDGSQHYLDEKILISDKRRTEFLENLGWTIIRIDWSKWKKYTKMDQKKIINNLHNICALK